MTLARCAGHRLWPRDAGGALLTVMIMVGLLSVLAVVLLVLIDSRQLALSNARLRGELHDIRRWAAASISLPMTAAEHGKSCAPPKDTIHLRSKRFNASTKRAPRLFPAAPVGRIGKWEVKATCAFSPSDPLRMEITVLAKKDGSSTWHRVTRSSPFVFQWTPQMWSLHP